MMVQVKRTGFGESQLGMVHTSEKKMEDRKRARKESKDV